MSHFELDMRGPLSSTVTVLLTTKSPKKTVPPTNGRNIGTGGRNPATSRELLEVNMVIVDCCVNYIYLYHNSVTITTSSCYFVVLAPSLSSLSTSSFRCKTLVRPVVRPWYPPPPRVLRRWGARKSGSAR
jgi:hypothetical protein